MLCLTYCVADSIDFVTIEQLKLLIFEKSLAKDVMFYRNEYEVFIFSNGTLIFWNATTEQAEALFQTILPALINPFEPRVRVQDSISYNIDPQQSTTIMPSEKINNDVMILNDDTPLLKLSFSYGLSRSIKLKSFDQRIEAIINRYAPLANAIYRKGKVNVSRRGVLKIIGELMVTKSEINLVNNFSYLPVFFWQNPRYEKQFVLIEKYMDIEIRAESLNARLNTLNEIFTLLNSYLEYKRSLFLEIAITVFVGIEVIVSFLNLHF